MRVYREKNREELREKAKIYNKENKHIRDAWRNQNRDKINEQNSKRNKETGYASKWRKKRKESVSSGICYI